MMTVADYLVSFLAARGVTHVFGYPGSPLIPLLAALERQTDVEFVLMRHENAAALAAGAQAKITGGLGVCVATSGPGALNAVCGVVDAHLDRVPLLALTGLVPTANQGHWEFQDIDQTRLFGSILPQSLTCVHPAQLPAILRNSVGYAEHRREAVHLALPADILSAEIDPFDPIFRLDGTPSPAPLPPLGPPAEVLDRVAAELDRFDRPVIVVGRGARGSGSAIEALARTLGAPIMTSLDGKGIVDESHPNAGGVLGIFGAPAIETTKRILRCADAVLAFGVDTLKPFLTDAQDVQRRVLIQCATEPSLLTQSYDCAYTLLGPLEAIADGLRDRVRGGARLPVIAGLEVEGASVSSTLPRPSEPDRDSIFAHPLDILQRLSGYMHERCTIALDTGAHTLWAAQGLCLTQRQQVLVSSRLGTMGFSLPAAIAAQLTRPDHRVIAICGDGGAQMVAGELATAVQHQLPIVIIVFNNGLLQNVAAQQTSHYGTVLRSPDFVALARAFGADGTQVDGLTDIDAVLEHAFASRDVPFVIDLRCDPDVIVPLSVWEREAALVGAR